MIVTAPTVGIILPVINLLKVVFMMLTNALMLQSATMLVMGWDRQVLDENLQHAKTTMAHMNVVAMLDFG